MIMVMMVVVMVLVVVQKGVEKKKGRLQRDCSCSFIPLYQRGIQRLGIPRV